MGLCLLQTYNPVVLILICVYELVYASNPTRVITEDRNMLTAVNAEPVYSHKVLSLSDLNTLRMHFMLLHSESYLQV